MPITCVSTSQKKSINICLYLKIVLLYFQNFHTYFGNIASDPLMSNWPKKKLFITINSCSKICRHIIVKTSKICHLAYTTTLLKLYLTKISIAPSNLSYYHIIARSPMIFSKKKQFFSLFLFKLRDIIPKIFSNQ